MDSSLHYEILNYEIQKWHGSVNARLVSVQMQNSIIQGINHKSRIQSALHESTSKITSSNWNFAISGAEGDSDE